MPRRPLVRRLAATLAGASMALGLLALAPAPADAAVSGASCVDGGSVRWKVAVTWGPTYTSGGTTKVSLDKAAWTTTQSGPVRTESRIRTYDGSGKRLQDLAWSGSVDYARGAVSKSRNPINPPSAPGRAKVVVTLGVAGDDFGSCSVTVTQPGIAISAADRYEADVLRATNRERTVRGLAAVKQQSCLDSSAEAQARRMAAEQRAFHQQLRPVLQACGLRHVGENVGLGYLTGAGVTTAWMTSPGHRANILKPEYRLIGVGAVQGSDGRWYSAQVFGTSLL